MSLLSAKELVAALGVSVITVKRAYLLEHIPGERIENALRFDLELVRKAMRARDRELRLLATKRKLRMARLGDSRLRGTSRPSIPRSRRLR